MGSEEFIVEEPEHKVCLNSYYLGIHEVTQKQFEQKILNGSAAYLRNERLQKNMGRAWRKPFKIIQDEGSLSGYLEWYGIGEETIKTGLADGSLILDKQIAKFANELIYSHKK